TPGAALFNEPFTGGSGDGIPGGSVHFGMEVSGHYTSSGQLGFGTYGIAYPGAAPQPGSIFFRRSDGMILRGSFVFAGQGACGNPDVPGVDCLSAKLTGTADIASVAVTIAAVTHFPRSYSFLMQGTLGIRARHGYVVVDANGRTSAFGGVEH